MKSLKEKWLSIVQSAEEKGEKGIGGSSTVTLSSSCHMVRAGKGKRGHDCIVVVVVTSQGGQGQR